MIYKLTTEEAKALRWFSIAIRAQLPAAEAGDERAGDAVRRYAVRLRRYQAWVRARLGLGDRPATFDEELGLVEVLP